MKKYFRGIKLIIDFGLRFFPKFEVSIVLVLFLLMFYFWSTYPERLIKLDAELTSKHSTLLKKDKSETYFEHIGNKYGTYGDSYGSLNALFSGAASLLLLLSLVLQRQELQAQRKELAAQRVEVSKANDIAKKQMLITEQQAELLEKQIEEAQVQNFYNIIYPLMNRKLNYYIQADHFPDHISERPIDNSVFYHVYSKSHIIYGIYCKENQGVNNDRDSSLKLIEQKINSQSGLIGPYYYLSNSQYIEHFIYIIQFIENFQGISSNYKNNAISSFLSDYSNQELFSISLVAITNDILLDLIVKHDLLARIKNIKGYDYDEVFGSVFSE